MPNVPAPPRVLDATYRRGIHRFPPSALLPLIAQAAGFWGQQPQGWLKSPYLKYTPWALADAARVSLLYGTEHRTARPSERDLLMILDNYSQLSGAFEKTGDIEFDMLHFLLRTAGEQMTWQEPSFNDLSRTAAMFLHTTSTKQLKHLVAGWDQAMFGCALTDYVGITQLLWAMVLDSRARGWFHIDSVPDFDRTSVDASVMPGLAKFVGKATTRRVIAEHFTASVDELRAEDARVNGKIRSSADYDPQLRRFEYNPLRVRPAVSGLGAESWLLCPSPHLVWEKATPWGICMSGREKLRGEFAPDVGHLFEQYIGRQLRLLTDAAVYGEIKYQGPGGVCDSADWIVVFDDLVLVVEAKSMIPTQPMRLGGAGALDDIVEKLTKAHRQIDATAELITAGNPAFASIPAGLPIHGMVATLQPFHIANFSGHRRLFPGVRTPVSIVSAAEVESLVTLEVPSTSRFLLDLAADAERSTWALTTVMQDITKLPNRILEEGWQSYPWQEWAEGSEAV